jgi:glyoxylase I family protein
MILGIEHTALSVPDIDRALDFYCGVLGFALEWRAGWPKGSPRLDDLVGFRDSAAKVAMVALGGTRIEIFEFEPGQARPQDPDRPVSDHGIAHIGLLVEGVEEEYERLRNVGVRFNAPPADVGGGSVCAYGRDPFGNVLEIREQRLIGEQH